MTLFIDTTGTGYERNFRHIAFDSTQQELQQQFIDSGLGQQHPTRKIVTFPKTSRKEVVSFFKALGISVK